MDHQHQAGTTCHRPGIAECSTSARNRWKRKQVWQQVGGSHLHPNFHLRSVNLSLPLLLRGRRNTQGIPERGDVIPKSEPGHIRDVALVEKQLSPFQAPVGAGERFNAGVCGDGLMDHQSPGTWSFLGSCDMCSCDA